MSVSKQEFDNATFIFSCDGIKKVDKNNFVVGKVQKGSANVGNKIKCFYPEKDIVGKIKKITKINSENLKTANEGELVALCLKGKQIEQIEKDDIFIIPGKTK